MACSSEEKGSAFCCVVCLHPHSWSLEDPIADAAMAMRKIAMHSICKMLPGSRQTVARVRGTASSIGSNLNAFLADHCGIVTCALQPAKASTHGCLAA